MQIKTEGILYFKYRHGINCVTGTKNATITNNIISNNGYFYYNGTDGNGIVAQNNQGFGTGNIRIYNNHILMNKGRGILLNDVTEIEVVDNTVANSGNSCMVIYETKNVFLALNKCIDSEFIVVKGKNENLLVYDQDKIHCSTAY